MALGDPTLMSLKKNGGPRRVKHHSANLKKREPGKEPADLQAVFFHHSTLPRNLPDNSTAPPTLNPYKI